MSVEENLRNLGARIGSQTAEVERQRRAYTEAISQCRDLESAAYKLPGAINRFFTLRKINEQVRLAKRQYPLGYAVIAKEKKEMHQSWAFERSMAESTARAEERRALEEIEKNRPEPEPEWDAQGRRYGSWTGSG